MLKHIFFLNLGQLWRHKLNSAISLVSLGTGLFIFFLCLLFVRHEFSYNRGWQDADSIYRVINREAAGNTALGVNTTIDEFHARRMLDYVQDFVSRSARTVLLATQATVARGENNPSTTLRVEMGEPDFAEIFRFAVSAGNMSAVWERPGQIALEAEKARMLFGSASAALGEQVTLSGRSATQADTVSEAGQDRLYDVVAVYELPDPVTAATRFEAVISINNYSLQLLTSRQGLPEYRNRLWLKALPGITKTQIESQLADFAGLEVNNLPAQDVLNVRAEFALESLADIYFNPETTDSFNEPAGNLARVYTLAIVGILVLLAGCSNSVSLGLAGALDRRREIGIRKSMGATGRHIFMQHQGESLILCAVALLPVLSLIHWYHPVFYNLFDIATMPEPGMQDYLLLSSLAFLVAIAIGFYPSLVLSRLKPVLVLKPHTVRPGSRLFSVRSLLVTMQFVFAVLLMSISLGLYIQLQHTLNRPTGFVPENLAQVYLDTEAARAELLPGLVNALSSLPGILQAGAIAQGPSTADNPGLEVVLRRTPDPADSIRALGSTFTEGQFALAGIPVLSGEPFRDSGQELENDQQTTAVVINRSAMTALGFNSAETAIGQEIFFTYQMLNNPGLRPVTVTAVVENSSYHNMKASPVPVVYTRSTTSNYIMFRYEEAVEENVVRNVVEIWQQITGRAPLDVFFVEDYLKSAWSDEINEGRLMLLCAVITVALASIGLFGMVSVNIRTAARDIAVRKVLGATSARIMMTYLGHYSMPVIISFLVAWPGAAYFVLQWIERFPQQLDKKLLLPVCLLAGLLVFGIALMTVLRVTGRAASQKPVNSLRYE